MRRELPAGAHNAALATAELKLKGLQRHVKIRDHQRAYVTTLRDTMDAHTCLLSIDFTGIDTKPTIVNHAGATFFFHNAWRVGG